jgi:hypothetical protein
LSDVLKKDLYVDDQASSFANESDAVSLVKGLCDVLSQGGFHLTKFVSNSSAVVESLKQISPEVAAESYEVQSQKEQSVLGIKWNVQDDTLSFPCSCVDMNEVPTRRSLLSAIAQMYDPATWCPFTNYLAS